MSAFLTMAVLMTAQPTGEDSRCPGATTIEANACAALDVAAAQERLDQYLEAARQRLSERTNDEALRQFEWARTVWPYYLGAECDAAYEYWREGTIRDMMSLDCRRRLIDARTHTVWQNWLTYADSTPPILPEPEPTPNSNSVR